MSKIFSPLVLLFIFIFSSASFAKEIPKDTISGDFDGDGRLEHLWVKASSYDEEGYALTPLLLRSDNPKFNNKYSWQPGIMGVLIFNLGKLDNGKCDHIGIFPYCYSNWGDYSALRWNQTKWHTSVKPFNVYLGDENFIRVRKSSKPGYVQILINDNPDVDDIWTPRWKTIKLR